ncbi:MAG: translation elongation factor Ts [Spirochaetes bacterium]|nr:translation elongation factor Ts [Spirochaetota bacterium]
MEIRAEDVKALREKTGAGMMDCKKALTEAGGDFKKAEKILKEIGAASAAKRVGRITKEGRIFTKISGSKAGILELTCETDFVARNQEFIRLGNEILSLIVDKGVSPQSNEITEKITTLISTIKENMILRRSDVISAAPDELIVEYVHGEGRIGVLVKAKVDKPELLKNEKVRAFVFDCALHVAAFSPQFLSEESIPPEYLKEQEEIFMKQAESLGKPANVLQGIVKGKLKKHFAEVCLLDQPFVRDDKRSVLKVAQDVGKEVGGTINIVQFLYYRVGEDLK